MDMTNYTRLDDLMSNAYKGKAFVDIVNMFALYGFCKEDVKEIFDNVLEYIDGIQAMSGNNQENIPVIPLLNNYEYEEKKWFRV